ncbi:UNVERIFIED_CONTAM: hydrolase [Mumia flava]|uniref:HAD family hydrolase n=1 Tax=Mumia flava TaxID=1348852 RepID=UPI000574664D|nr:HAD family phosphatase [Mumia flava]
MPAAVLWDLDGTIVDTEPVWLASEHALAARYGATWTDEDGYALVGNDLLESGRAIKQVMGLELSPEEIVVLLVAELAEHMRSGSLTWRPGAPELLAALHEAGVPQCLVTMSYRSIADGLVDRLPAGTFDAVITGDEVSHGKPHPEPYLAAARALGVDPTACVAIEDSTTGTRSAAAAGCAVLAVPNHVEIAPGDRISFTDTLAGLAPDDLLRLTDAPPLD